jgi:hypothetical protein
MDRRRSCIYRNDAEIAAAVTAGDLSEHDATAIRRFIAFLRQAPEPPSRKPPPEEEPS